MSWILTAGFAFRNHFPSQSGNAESAIAIRDPQKVIPDLPQNILLSEQTFKTAFTVLNLASVIYDLTPRQKTLVKTKQVLTTDDEGNTFNTKVTEKKQYNVTQNNTDAFIKLVAGIAPLFISDKETLNLAFKFNIIQGLYDITGMSDCFKIHANEINGDDSFEII